MHLFKKFKCETCEKKFKQQEELMQHIQVVHGKDTPYDCKQCNESFSSMEQMRTHLQKYHSYKGTRDI
ncbi:MAG TPA: C2H2-type zinc finger protein [Nitrosopumilaceae archaeon]|nr:C2H2-type zinc finger protein [Nitrosopumilaceae archaeon]